MAFIQEGEKAPAFKGLNQNGEEVSLEDFKGRKLILFFYPKDGTPGCTAEACNLRDNYEVLTEKGFALLGVSPDSQRKHTNFINKHGFRFDLIADTEQEILKMFGAWGEKQMFGKKYDGVLRSTFVINEEGVIEKVFAKVKTKNHTEQILEAVG